MLIDWRKSKMFNTTNTTNTVKINACNGGIYKTYKESWFIRFNFKSILSDKLFRKEKCFYNVRTNKFAIDEYELKCSSYDDKNIYEVVVLQMIICGEDEVIAELITKDDFDKKFAKEGESNG